MTERPTPREHLIIRSMALLDEIQQMFIDCQSWNEHVRKPGEEPIDCDPDGQLRRIVDGLDRMLASEARL